MYLRMSHKNVTQDEKKHSVDSNIWFATSRFNL